MVSPTRSVPDNIVPVKIAPKKVSIEPILQENTNECRQLHNESCVCKCEVLHVLVSMW